MIQPEIWLKQRIKLLRLQLQEWRDDVLQEKQTRDLLVDQYRHKQASLDQRADSIEWARYEALYNDELYKLINESLMRRIAMERRHQLETAMLEKQIRQKQLEFIRY